MHRIVWNGYYIANKATLAVQAFTDCSLISVFFHNHFFRSTDLQRFSASARCTFSVRPLINGSFLHYRSIIPALCLIIIAQQANLSLNDLLPLLFLSSSALDLFLTTEGPAFETWINKVIRILIGVCLLQIFAFQIFQSMLN